MAFCAQHCADTCTCTSAHPISNSLVLTFCPLLFSDDYYKDLILLLIQCSANQTQQTISAFISCNAGSVKVFFTDFLAMFGPYNNISQALQQHATFLYTKHNVPFGKLKQIV